jgi:hypothetical protein
VLSKQEYNLLAQNRKDWTPSRCLIASAGRGKASGIPRAPGWEDDFFFENLKLSSVIGANSQGRGSNVIDISFNIIEPLGLSLLDRMIRTSQDMGVKSYIGLCYLLQIDFHVADGVELAEGGGSTLTKHRKYIPINIVDLTVKVSAKGSEYDISAVPFSHHALSHTLGATPANFEVNGATLREFFRADDSASSSIASAGAATTFREETAKPKPGETREAQANATSTGDQKKYIVNSYCAAYNAWQKKLVELGALKQYNTIEVLFHDEILKGEKITREDKTIGSTVMGTPGNHASQNVPIAEKVDRWTFPAGTMITEVINSAMLNSDYIRNQVIVGEDSSNSGKPQKLNWWKVVPAVELTEYDDVTQKWYFKVRYMVIPYVVHNATHINAPKWVVQRADCIKEYSYFYTGENTSVIDFQAQFDYLYFTKVSSLRTDKNESSEARKELQNVKGEVSTISETKNAIVQAITHPVTGEIAVQGTGVGKDIRGIAVSSIAENIYTKGQAEMLNISIKIVGDPTWIKQDDLFISGHRFFDPGKKNAGSDGVATDPDYNNRSLNLANNNESLVMDAGEVLCWLQLKNPVDMDENTGTTRAGVGAVSSFTGVYKCITVDSEFTGGKFTQTLDLIRIPDQEQDKLFASLSDTTVKKSDNLEIQQRGSSNDKGNGSGDVVKAAPTSTDSSAVVTNPIPTHKDPDAAIKTYALDPLP